MTLNITVASPRFVICATDRRLTYSHTRKIVTEQSTKLTMLRCIDALSLIAYNGIGKHQGKTPADWLQELDNRVGLTTLTLKCVLQAIREEAESRIATLPTNCDRRHSFVLGAWGRGRTWICVISNYESACSEVTFDKAQDRFEISALPEEAGREVRVLVTGSTQDAIREDLAKIGKVAKKAGAAGADIKNLCVKMIQHTARKRNRRGTVGSSVLWAIAERFRGVEGGLDVPGGTAIQEMPRMIVPGMQCKDIRIEVPRGEPISWGKPFPLPEAQCSKCRNPVPLGYKVCGVCGTAIS